MRKQDEKSRSRSRLPGVFSENTGESCDATYTRRRKWTFVLVFLSTLVLGALAYLDDIQLSLLIRKIGDVPGDLRRILALSELIAHGSGVCIILGIVWYLAPGFRLHLPRIACCAFLAGIAANVIKLFHARLRPLLCPPQIEETAMTWRGWFPTMNEQLGQPYDYALQSFPSAHTATAVGFAIGIAWLYPRARYLFYSLAILAGLQRIVFMAHWPSDVCFGAAIGVLVGATLTTQGTIGNSLFNTLEWKLGLGRDLESVAIGKNRQDQSDKRAA